MFIGFKIQPPTPEFLTTKVKTSKPNWIIMKSLDYLNANFEIELF